MVTLITQSQSEFALHLRAVLGLPLDFSFYTPGASAAYKAKTESVTPVLSVDEKAFAADSFVRIFGKPKSHEGRRMAVVLTMAASESEALAKAKERIGYLDDEVERKEEVEEVREESEEETCVVKKVFKFIFGS
jgi:phosphoribosylglycinamide formyltransferase 2